MTGVRQAPEVTDPMPRRSHMLTRVSTLLPTVEQLAAEPASGRTGRLPAAG